MKLFDRERWAKRLDFEDLKADVKQLKSELTELLQLSAELKAKYLRNQREKESLVKVDQKFEGEIRELVNSFQNGSLDVTNFSEEVAKKYISHQSKMHELRHLDKNQALMISQLQITEFHIFKLKADITNLNATVENLAAQNNFKLIRKKITNEEMEDVKMRLKRMREHVEEQEALAESYQQLFENLDVPWQTYNQYNFGKNQED